MTYQSNGPAPAALISTGGEAQKPRIDNSIIGPAMQVLAARMAGHGLECPPDLEPGRFRRFPGAGKRNGNEAGWCKIFDDGQAAVFGDYSTGLTETCFFDPDHKPTAADRQMVAATRQQAHEARKVSQEKAAEQARSEWESAFEPEDHNHPYLVRKGIQHIGTKQNLKTQILVPLRNAAGELRSIQYIKHDGEKRFFPGGEIRGFYHAIGKPTPDDDTILICEGYATGASLRQSCAPAPVVVAFNAGNLKPVAEVIRQKFPDHKIVICADDDHLTPGNPGLTKARAAAAAVGGVVAVPEFGPDRQNDETDFNDLERIQGGHTVLHCVQKALEWGTKVLAKETTQKQPEPKPGKTPSAEGGVNLICAADVAPEPVKWLWPGWLAAGKLHILAGAPGTGKSTLAFALGATVTIGGRWPHGNQTDAGEVLIWSGEDDPADTIVPRLLACGADLNKVHLLGGITGPDPRPFDPSVDFPALRATLAGRKIRLLIVDPVVSAVGADSNSNQNAEVRRSLQPLVDLAASTGCAVLGISHFSKGTAGRDPVERVTGSLAFGALARVVLATAKLPEEEYGGARLLARAKSNIGPDTGGFHYHMEQTEIPGHPGIINTRILWGKAVDGAARDLLASAEREGDENKSATATAMQWLQDLLGAGAMKAAEVSKEARAAGIASKPLRAARERLRIKSSKIGFPGCWWWSLEDAHLSKMPEAAHSPEKGKIGE